MALTSGLVLSLGVAGSAWAAPDARRQHRPAATQETGGTAMDPPEESVGSAPAPAAPRNHAADAYFPADRMAAARRTLIGEMRPRYHAFLLDRLEYRAGGEDGFAWKGEASTGGDHNRFVLSSDGEGVLDGGLDHADVDEAEVRAVWRHALDPWFDAELGARQDFGPGSRRAFLVAGVRGLAPYWIEAEAHAFLSDRGEAHVRIEAETDFRITQRLILQPAAELDFALQDVPELGDSSGLTEAKLAARLRYQTSFGFAPYIGVEWRRRGRAPASAPPDFLAQDRTEANLLVGLRAQY